MMGAGAANAEIKTWDIGSPTATSVVATLNTEDSTFTISGTGAMEDYSYTMCGTSCYTTTAPWAQYYAQMTSVVIESGVTSIGECAFYYCSGLTSVIIGNSVTSISTSTFSNCTGLTAFAVDNANTAYSAMDGILFNNNKTMLLHYPASKSGTTYAIPNSVTSIGGRAFESCSGLTNVTIGNSVTSIGNYAFESSGLTSVTIPNNITSIRVGTFRHCSSLTSVTIPNSVTSIGGAAFDRCSSLTSVTIPNSVTSIGSLAFSNCSSLIGVQVGWDIPLNIDANVFNGYSDSCLLTVPAGLEVRYARTPVWSDFFAIEGKQSTYTVTFNSRDGSAVAPQIIAQGAKVVQPAAPTRTGYTFDGWFHDIACQIEWFFNSDLVTSNITLYAKWTDTQTISEMAALQAHVAALQLDSTAKQGQITSLETQLAALPDTVIQYQTDTVYVPQNVYIHDTIAPYVNISVSGASMFPSLFNIGNLEYIINKDLSSNQPTVINVIIGDKTYAITIPNAANGATAIVETKNLAPLQIYPNPVSDQITITSDQWNAGDKVEIYNVNGTKVLETSLSIVHYPLSINIAHLPAGIYIVRVGTKVAKVVKQ
ncbi:hypothetical protein FACS189452_02380 [Bacteroidia bacterium]|nr:hypothetical protein FACS189452_02380 [Bacteroidia bacterium]